MDSCHIVFGLISPNLRYGDNRDCSSNSRGDITLLAIFSSFALQEMYENLFASSSPGLHFFSNVVYHFIFGNNFISSNSNESGNLLGAGISVGTASGS